MTVSSALGLMNSHIPEEYGGLGLGGVETCIIGGWAQYLCGHAALPAAMLTCALPLQLRTLPTVARVSQRLSEVPHWLSLRCWWVLATSRRSSVS
jgi:alkylation response protein AidB-like acyl-CoA dehydrogenase